MTDRQRIFCDEYLTDLNRARAYMAAYPNCKTESGANGGAHRLMAMAEVREYIEKRMDEKASDLIAKQDEVLKTLTRILRREETDATVTVFKKRKIAYDEDGKKITDDISEPVILNIPAKISDVNRAAEMLSKYYGTFDKQQSSGDTGTGGVIILPEVEFEEAEDG